MVNFETIRSEQGSDDPAHSWKRSNAVQNKPFDHVTSSLNGTAICQLFEAPVYTGTACSKCAEASHIARECTKPRVLFCWQCGRRGALTTECCRRLENGPNYIIQPSLVSLVSLKNRLVPAETPATPKDTSGFQHSSKPVCQSGSVWPPPAPDAVLKNPFRQPGEEKEPATKVDTRLASVEAEVREEDLKPNESSTMVHESQRNTSQDQKKYYDLRRQEWRPSIGSVVMLRQHMLSDANEAFNPNWRLSIKARIK